MTSVIANAASKDHRRKPLPATSAYHPVEALAAMLHTDKEMTDADYRIMHATSKQMTIKSAKPSLSCAPPRQTTLEFIDFDDALELDGELEDWSSGKED